MYPKTIFTQNPNEGFEEFHENHFETIETTETTETFHDWYESRLLRFTTSGEHLKASILKQCYYKILHYQIDQTSCGYEMCDFQLIHRCSSLHQQYCRSYLFV